MPEIKTNDLSAKEQSLIAESHRFVDEQSWLVEDFHCNKTKALKRSLESHKRLVLAKKVSYESLEKKFQSKSNLSAFAYGFGSVR